MENPPIYILKLDMPHRDLSPNRENNVHWSIRAKLKQKGRYASMIATKIYFHKLLTSNLFEPYRKATIKTVFYCKTKRTRDARNFASACKATDDGIVDAGLLSNDDQITWMPVEFIVDKNINCSYMEYHFYKLEY